MKRLFLCFVFLLLCSPLVSVAFPYDVILKNGKVVKGKFISEDEVSIVLQDASGFKISVKKTNIDMVKTATANQIQASPPDDSGETEVKNPEKPADTNPENRNTINIPEKSSASEQRNQSPAPTTERIKTLSTENQKKEDVYFKKLSYYRQEGDKRKEYEARLIFRDDEILITDQDRPERATYAEMPIASIEKIVYEKSSHPRWKTAIFLSPFALFAKGKKHWLTIQYQKPDKTEDFVFLRLDKDNYQMILATTEARTGKTVEKMLED